MPYFCMIHHVPERDLAPAPLFVLTFGYNFLPSDLFLFSFNSLRHLRNTFNLLTTPYSTTSVEVEATGFWPSVHLEHTFVSFEQYYQYARAMIIPMPEQKINKHLLCSKHLKYAILMCPSPLLTSILGRSFNSIRKIHYIWDAQWRLVCGAE